MRPLPHATHGPPPPVNGGGSNRAAPPPILPRKRGRGDHTKCGGGGVQSLSPVSRAQSILSVLLCYLDDLKRRQHRGIAFLAVRKSGTLDSPQQCPSNYRRWQLRLPRGRRMEARIKRRGTLWGEAGHPGGATFAIDSNLHINLVPLNIGASEEIHPFSQHTSLSSRLVYTRLPIFFRLACVAMHCNPLLLVPSKSTARSQPRMSKPA